MGQSLVKVHVHLVFSTKNRQKLIDDFIEKQLHSYLAQICITQKAFVTAVGGYKDHIHILFEMPKMITIAALIQKIKGDSSHWIKSVHPRYRNFYWQDGYGILSVDSRGVEVVKNYILNQHEHHKVTTFEEEFLGLLTEAGIEYDEQYVLN